MASGDVASVTRAVELLHALRTLPEGAGARQLSEATGIARSTAQRLLSTLSEAGLVVQDPATQRYGIGPQALLIGLGFRRGLDLLTMARPRLNRLRDETGETVGLSVRAGGARVFIDEVQSSEPLRFASELGRMYPVWSGANGQVLISGCSRAEVQELAADESLAGQMARVPSLEDRIRRVAHARIQGWAIAEGETIADVSSVAAPVYDHAGDIAAALSVSGPSSRMTAVRSMEILPAVIRAAQDLGGV